jgi:UDPglucose 6-dehydrogenase
MTETKHTIGDDISYVNDPYDALDGADALLVVTEWSEFKLPDWEVISSKLKSKVVFDGRNIYDKKELRDLGYDYYCIGSK